MGEEGAEEEEGAEAARVVVEEEGEAVVEEEGAAAAVGVKVDGCVLIRSLPYFRLPKNLLLISRSIGRGSLFASIVLV